MITGVTGQDRGHEVLGVDRRGGNLKSGRLDAHGLTGNIKLIPVEITDLSNALSNIYLGFANYYF